MPSPIYLDYNATTPHDPEVIAAMRPFLEEEFGNPSSTHWYGEKPKKAVIKARRQVASLLNCQAEEIIFTSGGTEANNHALIGGAQAYRDRGNHIITCQIEHPAILEVCAYLEQIGLEVTCLPVDDLGLVNVADVASATRSDTILISVMHANNEVGTIQPIAEIAEFAKERGIMFHTDAAQSAGKISVDIDTLGVDLLSIAGHKVYAPKGVGALFVRQGRTPEKMFMHGAGQEMGQRSGTENVMQIVGLGKACEIANRDLERNFQHMQAMRDRLYAGLQQSCGPVRLNGHPQKRLPNTLSLSFRGLEANRLLEEIGPEVAASAGAACHSGKVETSYVLDAIGVPVEWAMGTLRLTTGRLTSTENIDKAVAAIVRAVRKLNTKIGSIM